MPKNTRFTQIAGVSLLAGIGFTMSIFVAQLGFAHNEELLLMAKTGILLASLLAGVAGFIWLYLVSDTARYHRWPVKISLAPYRQERQAAITDSVSALDR